MFNRVVVNRNSSLFARINTSLSARQEISLRVINPRNVTLFVLVGVSLWFVTAVVFGTLPPTVNKTLYPIPDYLVLTVAIVYFLSGIVKGLSGIGMGLICVPVISLLYNPGLAVLLISIPLVVTNFHQGIVSGNVRKTLKDYSLLAIVMVSVMVATVYMSADLEPSVVTNAVGISAIAFVILNLGIKSPAVSDGHDSIAQLVTGCAAGVVGGLTGLVVIPLVMYMMLRKIRKNEFVAVSGFLLFLSGVALLVGSNLNESLTLNLVILSAMAAVPALCGTLLGESLRKWVSEKAFRKIVLCLILLIGVNTVLP